MSRKVNATYTGEEVKNSFKLFEGDPGESAPGHIDVKRLEVRLGGVDSSLGGSQSHLKAAMMLVTRLPFDGIPQCSVPTGSSAVV